MFPLDGGQLPYIAEILFKFRLIRAALFVPCESTLRRTENRVARQSEKLEEVESRVNFARVRPTMRGVWRLVRPFAIP